MVNIDKKLVVKDNRLIEANYKLSLREQRFMLLLISMIKKTDEEFKKYRITAKEFADTISKKNVYQTLSEISDSLLSRVLTIYNKEDKTLLKCNWISSLKYYKEKGFVDVSFDPALKEYLLKLKKSFTRYNLKAVARINSVYSIRIYELLKQYENIGKRKFSLKKLKEILRIENKYKLYANFKRKVILRAQKDLYDKTDIDFDFIENKEGRKVVSLTFIIKKDIEKTEDKDVDITGMSKENKKIYKKLINYFCLSKKQSLLVLQRYKEGYIESVLSYVEKQIKTDSVENIGAYTNRALSNGWMDKKSQFEIDAEKEKEKKEKDKIQEKKKENQEIKNGKKIYDDLGLEEKKQVVNQILDETRDDHLKTKIELFGFESSPERVKNTIYKKISKSQQSK